MHSRSHKSPANNTDVATTASAKQQASLPAVQLLGESANTLSAGQLQQAANNSDRVRQLKTLQNMADTRSGRNVKPSGSPKTTESLEQTDATSLLNTSAMPVQGKFVVQRAFGDNDYRAIPESNTPAYPWRGEITRGWHGSRETDDSWRNRGMLPDEGRMTNTKKGEYGVLGASVTTAGAGRVTSMASPGEAAAPYVGYLGGASGVLGGISDTINAGRSAGEALDSANNSSTRIQSGMESVGSLASATRSSATAALNFADVSGSAISAGAQTAAGAAGIVTGAADMISGGYGAYVASGRRNAIATSTATSRNEDMRLASRIAMASQEREQTRGKAKIGKGAAAIAGGILLVTSATPVGWFLLTGAAAIGAAAALYNYIKKRKHKREMAIDILGIRDTREDWKRRKKQIEKDTWWGTARRKNELKAIGDDPLDVALKVNGYEDAAHCYNNYVNTISNRLYQWGVVGHDFESTQLIENMGLTINRETLQPTAEKISKKLSI